ncbi:MAG: hypothetical protein NTW50_05260 [Candidatus Berkelbacteria bacterium]|nr:hypothetical protein [Candidatus Berkelbacteria bacterium]
MNRQKENCNSISRKIGEILTISRDFDQSVRVEQPKSAYIPKSKIEKIIESIELEKFHKIMIADTEVYDRGGKKLEFAQYHFPMAVSPDGEKLAVLSQITNVSSIITITSVSDRSTLSQIFLPIEYSVRGDFGFDETGDSLQVFATSSDTFLSRIFTFETATLGHIVENFNFHKKLAKAKGAYNLLPKEKAIIFESDKNGLSVIWDNVSGQAEMNRRLGFVRSKMLKIEVLRDYVFTLHTNHQLKIWNRAKDGFLEDLQCDHPNEHFQFYGIEFYNDQKSAIILAGDEKERWICSLNALYEVRPVMKIPEGFLPTHFCFDPATDKAYLADELGNGAVFDAVTGRLSKFYNGTPETKVMKISYAAGKIFCGCADGRVRVFSAEE